MRLAVKELVLKQSNCAIGLNLHHQAGYGIDE
jgi:hypothetical protein